MNGTVDLAKLFELELRLLIEPAVEDWRKDLTQGAAATCGPCPLPKHDPEKGDMEVRSLSPSDYAPRIVGSERRTLSFASEDTATDSR